MKIFFDETQKERGKISTNYSILRDSLRNEGFQTEAYNDFPITDKSLKCDIFVFACPDGSKIAKNEIDALTAFVERGGGLLVIGNAGGDRGLRTNMNELLNKFGIEMLSDQVKDEANNEFNMPTHPVIKDIKNHAICNGVSEIAIVAGCSIRGSTNMKGIAYTSPTAEPPNVPVIIAGEHKAGKVVAVGSYRLFSNYGAGLSLRNNKTLALNIFRWLIGKATATGGVTTSVPPIPTQIPPPPPQKTTTTTPSRIEGVIPQKPTQVSGQTTQSSPIPPPPPTTVSKPQTVNANYPSNVADQSVIQEIERLRGEISEMRDIIARLYSDSLGYLQEMKEEVRAMLDYIRTKEG
ncbi:MAG: hypothetical protein ACFFDW_09740 [Candidatus Thorarchaeota archaeon]